MRWKIEFFNLKKILLLKNAQGISKIYPEVLILMIFLQTKPQVKVMNNNYFDLYYFVIKTRDDNESVDVKYEDKENDYINFNDFTFLIILLGKNLVKQFWDSRRNRRYWINHFKNFLLI